MNPWNTYAVATAWSVRRSWYTLINHATSGSVEDDIPLRSVSVGVVGRASGYNDPAAIAALTRTRSGTNYGRTVDTARDAINSAYWLPRSALRNRPSITGPVLVQLVNTLPLVDPDTARDAARHLDHADTTIRQYLALPPDHRPLDRNPACPTCGLQMLRLWTSPNDRADWTVICTAPRKPQTVPHIWAGDQAAHLLKNGAAA